MNLDERLRLSSCIDDYKLQEVVVVLASTGGGGGLQQQQSVHDLPPTVNSKKSLVTVTSSSNTMNINSSKSGLRSNHSSDSTLNHGSVGGEKKKRGLFGLFGFGRNNKKGSVSRVEFSFEIHSSICVLLYGALLVWTVGRGDARP